MKIRKFLDFISEEMHDTPESYIETALKQIKRKIDAMFDPAAGAETEEDRPSSVGKAKEMSKPKNKMSLKDLGVELESSEISKYSKMYDSLTVKFTDAEATYSLLISIDIKDGMPKDPAKDFSFEDIEKCYMKFKKYDLDTFEVIGQLTKNAKIKDIDEEFLVDLKIELDDKFGNEEEKLEIETEEKGKEPKEEEGKK